MPKKYDLSIIVPAYNEKENIKELLERLVRLKLNHEIIVVDDSSPDGTAEAAKEFSKKHKNVKVFVRKERGLSSAILHGIKNSSSGIVCDIDADLQHPPEIIPKMLEEMKAQNADIVIASRYKNGSSIEAISTIRKILSKNTILVSRLLFPRIRNVKDPFTGFFIMKKGVLENVKMNAIGYRFLLETLIKGNYSKVCEIPFEFAERRYGKTKLDFKEHIRHAKILLNLRFSNSKTNKS